MDSYDRMVKSQGKVTPEVLGTIYKQNGEYDSGQIYLTPITVGLV